MVDSYDKLDERVTEIQALEKRGDEIDREVNRAARGRVRHAVRSRGHPRAGGPSRRRRRRHPGHRRDVRDLRRQRTDRRGRRLAAILAEQAVELAAALRKLDGLKDLEPPSSTRSTTSRTRPTACRGRRSPGCSARATTPHRGHQVARPLHLPRGHDRRGRGRRRGHRADVPQGELSPTVSDRPTRAGASIPAGSPRCRARAIGWRTPPGSARAAAYASDPHRGSGTPPGRMTPSGFAGCAAAPGDNGSGRPQRANAASVQPGGRRSASRRPRRSRSASSASARWGAGAGAGARAPLDGRRTPSGGLPAVGSPPDRDTAGRWGPGERTTVGMPSCWADEINAGLSAGQRSGRPAEDVADAADRVDERRVARDRSRSGCAASGRGRRRCASRRRSRSPRRARAAGRG